MRKRSIWSARLLASGLLLAFGFAPARGGSVEEPWPEYTVKAALLLKIAKFVTWPGAMESRPEFGVCVLGRDPFESALDPLQTQKVHGRTVKVIRQPTVTDVAACDIVYVGERDPAKAAQFVAQLGKRPVLTVGEATSFARDGGMVALQTRNRRIRFEVNLPAAQGVGVEISSQLLQLASVVHNGGDGARR